MMPVPQPDAPSIRLFVRCRACGRNLPLRRSDSPLFEDRFEAVACPYCSLLQSVEPDDVLRVPMPHAATALRLQSF